MKIVEWVEEYAKANDKKVLYVLSYSRHRIVDYYEIDERPDREFADFLKKRRLPVVDLMEAHIKDYQGFTGDIEQYLERYFIGHYNPLGNFFTAFAIKDKVTEMLDPKPIPYRK